MDSERFAGWSVMFCYSGRHYRAGVKQLTVNRSDSEPTNYAIEVEWLQDCGPESEPALSPIRSSTVRECPSGEAWTQADGWWTYAVAGVKVEHNVSDFEVMHIISPDDEIALTLFPPRPLF